MSQRGTRKTSARERAAAMRQAQLRAERRRRALVWGSVGVVVAAAIVGLVFSQLGAGSAAASKQDTSAQILSGPPGPEGIVLETGKPLASLATAAGGQRVDGISCNSSEQVAYHIHTHLSVFVDGVLRPIPAGIGIVKPAAQQTSDGPFYGATTCYYWLHVHAQDGIIHIESPSVATYTLGQFFAEWGQPLSASRVAGARGTVTAFVNGKRFVGDPANITLGSREDIQLDVGAPIVAPKRIDWSHSQL